MSKVGGLLQYFEAVKYEWVKRKTRAVFNFFFFFFFFFFFCHPIYIVTLSLLCGLQLPSSSPTRKERELVFYSGQQKKKTKKNTTLICSWSSSTILITWFRIWLWLPKARCFTRRMLLLRNQGPKFPRRDINSVWVFFIFEGVSCLSRVVHPGQTMLKPLKCLQIIFGPIYMSAYSASLFLFFQMVECLLSGLTLDLSSCSCFNIPSCRVTWSSRSSATSNLTWCRGRFT